MNHPRPLVTCSTTRSRLGLCGLFLLLSMTAVAGEPPYERARADSSPEETEARTSKPENYCLGGIEDRKIIVHERQLTNPFEQTTLLGCEVDGGDARVMPDLPAPSPVYEVLG